MAACATGTENCNSKITKRALVRARVCVTHTVCLCVCVCARAEGYPAHRSPAVEQHVAKRRHIEVKILCELGAPFEKFERWPAQAQILQPAARKACWN
jgi:hypothetical protein